MVERLIAELAEQSVCTHQQGVAHWDYSQCANCGWVNPSGDRSRRPNNGWFPSMAAFEKWKRDGEFFEAEQPAEPVAWMVLHDGEFDYFVYANKHEADSAADINNTVATPLYARPDPRVAELEALLREALNYIPTYKGNETGSANFANRVREVLKGKYDD